MPRSFWTGHHGYSPVNRASPKKKRQGKTRTLECEECGYTSRRNSLNDCPACGHYTEYGL